MEVLNDAKIILGYLKRYKKPVIQTAVLNMALSGILASIPFIYGRLIDTIDPNPGISSMIFYLLGIWTLLSLVSVILRRVVSMKGSFISIDAFCDLTCEETRRIVNFPLSFHREKKIGEIISLINRSTDALRFIIEDVVFWILPQFLTVFAGIFILLFVDWRLSMGTLIVFLLSIIVTLFKSPAVFEAEKELNKKFEEGLGVLNDSLLNIQSVKSFAAEEFENKKIEKAYKGSVASAFKGVIVNWENTVVVQEIIFSCKDICL